MPYPNPPYLPLDYPNVPYPSKVVIKNIGKIVTGDINNPIAKGDTIYIENGKIAKVGWESEVDLREAELVIDANGMTVIPGLIEPHCHVAPPDYSPITKTVDFLEGLLYAGITTVVSEGAHGPGYPKYYDDPVGSKAEAIFFAMLSKYIRPGGAQKFEAGAVVLVHGLKEEDFKEMAEAGVKYIAEIGGGGIWEAEEVNPMLGWAKKYGMIISVHTGPPSIPVSAHVAAENILNMNPKPDKLAHFNGGSTPLPWKELERLLNELPKDIKIEIVYHGNLRIAKKTFEVLKERKELNRVVLGTDQAIGLAMSWGSLWVLMSWIPHANDIPPETVVAMATGNTADLFGFNRGKIEVGREADIVITDKPPASEAEDFLDALAKGDICAPAMVMVDGKIVSIKGRDYQPTERSVLINGIPAEVFDINDYLFGIPYARFNPIYLAYFNPTYLKKRFNEHFKKYFGESL